MTRDYPRSLLGLPERIEDSTLRSWSAALDQTWEATMQARPSALEADLLLCRRWFDPVAQGQRLRRELGELQELPEELLDPGPPLTFRVGPRKRLVTPEGRCALDLLQDIASSDEHLIRDSRLLVYDRLLAGMYRDWTRHRLQSVVDLLSGSTKPLQVAAAGVVIALLVDGCTSRERALTRFASGPAREVVDQAFFSSIEAFAGVLAPSQRRGRTNPRLISGWMLYEARRRLGGGLVVEDARSGLDGRVWINREAEADVIEVVTRDLARGHRARATPERFAEAYDALVQSLRRELPRLAGYGLVHERPPETERLRERFLASLRTQLAEEP
jgi:hypothetical protein